MGADFIYDIERIQNAKKSIDDLKDNLDESLGQLNKSLADLKNGWQTDAGRKFFDEHKDTWTKYVKKYVKKLEGVSNMLNSVCEEYERASQEVKNLKI